MPYFNPRTYVRCDLDGVICKGDEFDFNPRTYVRCDDYNTIISIYQYDFNPRTYVRCDLGWVLNSDFGDEFQSTHLREVRPGKTFLGVKYALFQSTHLREVRLFALKNLAPGK